MYYDINDKKIKHTAKEYPCNYNTYIYKNDYQKTDKCVYSDRLFQWNGEKFNKCRQAVKNNHSQMFYSDTPDEIQQFLNLYFEKPILLTGIKQGYNASSGFPYWEFYYREV